MPPVTGAQVRDTDLSEHVRRQIFSSTTSATLLVALATAVLALASWNLPVALLLAGAVYFGVFVKSDGGRLVLFLRSIGSGKLV